MKAYKTTSQFLSIILQGILVTIVVIFTCASCGKKAQELRVFYDLSINKDDVDELVRGKLAYYIPVTMRVDSSYRVTAAITKSLNDSTLLLSFKQGDFETYEVMVTSKVKVVLIDPSPVSDKCFSIDSLSTAEQTVDTISSRAWSWQVKPLISGKNQLLLRATVKVKDTYGEGSKDIPIFEKTVEVPVAPLFTLSTFIGKYWQWLSGLLLPFPIWTLFNRRRDRRSRMRR